MNRLKALILLQECTGDEIWSLEHCRMREIPEDWIEELTDCFESGFQVDYQTIYVENRITNHYLGIRDVDLAITLGRLLGLPVDHILASAISRRGIVQAIREAADEN